MPILVTGGAGFVGSHVVDRLREEGREVRVLDDLSSGSVANLSAHAGAAGVALERGDVRDRALVERLVAGADAVLHLAGAVGVRRVADDPAGTWSRNVEGTASVLEACARRGVRCLVASTSEVYGPAATGVLVEDAPATLDPAARRDVYAVSKLAGESLALALHRSAGLPATVVRLFNVVGARQAGRYGMVLPRFARAAVRGEPLAVHGDGRQTRCFLHVADAVDALLALLRAPAAEGRIVNVGSDEEVEIGALARAVVAAAGSSSEIRSVPFADVYGAGFVDPPRRRPSLDLLRSLTGLRPRRRLADAVADVVRSVRAREPNPALR
jgi:UDP-glucose 4-epimerase